MHPWRLLMIVPVEKTAALAGWMHAYLGENSVPADLGPGLNATGLSADPATHRWCNAAWTEPECRAILVGLANLSGLPSPPAGEWAAWTPPQKSSWLLSVRDTIHDRFGAWVAMAENGGEWDDPHAEAGKLGLLPQGAADALEDAP